MRQREKRRAAQSRRGPVSGNPPKCRLCGHDTRLVVIQCEYSFARDAATGEIRGTEKRRVCRGTAHSDALRRGGF